MKALSLLLLAVLCCSATRAGPIADQFQGGFNGATWGGSIDNIVSMFPPGDHVFAVTPGGRGYWVKDPVPLLDVPREGQGILFGFNESDALDSITLGFSYDRKEQVFGALISAFGAFERTGTRGTKTFHCWKRDMKILLCFWASKGSKHGIAWLTISARNQEGRQAKPAANNSQGRAREP